MQGRLESDKRIRARTGKLLEDSPEYLKEYYYSLSSVKTPSTAYNYVVYVKAFINSLKTQPNRVSDIKVSDVGEFFNSKMDKSNNYIRMLHSSLSSFFDYFVMSGEIEKNPLVTIKKPKARNMQEKDCPTVQEFNELVEYVRVESNPLWVKQNILILYMLMLTGMRVSALTEIDISDFDFKNATVSVITKGEKRQVYNILPIRDKIIDYIETDRKRILDGYPMTEALFLSTHRKRISVSAVQRFIKAMSERAWVGSYTPHDFRRAFVTTLLEKTGDIAFVSRAVGHSDVSTTMRYAISNGKESEKSAEILGSMLKLK